MLSFINELISLKALIWLLPIAFFIHDGEEILTMEKWLRNHQNHPRIAVENRLLSWKKNITFQFSVAVLTLGLILCLITSFGAKAYMDSGKLNMLYAGVVAVILLDGIKHVGFTLALKKYSSGVITAMIVEIPYASYALYRFYTAGATDVMMIAMGLVIDIPLVLFLVWLGLTVGRTVAPYRRNV